MKVLLVTQDFPPVEGGMARFYESLVSGFPGGEIIVSTVAATGPGHSPPESPTLYRESFDFRTAHRPFNQLRWSSRLESLMRSERPDILLCGNIRPLGPICWQAHRRHGIPLALIVHGNDVLSAHRRWSGWRRPLWNAITGAASLYLTNSRGVAAIAASRCDLDPSRCAVLYPEVDTVRFSRYAPLDKRRSRALLGLPEEDPVILFVGRLVTRKGLDNLIEALASHVADRRFCLAIAGYGDTAPYRRLAESCGLSGRTRFLGAVTEEQLPDVYGAADLLAMPARSIPERGDVEGFGIVYLEAAASGLASIAGRSGGAPEAVRDGTTGIVVDGDSVAEIASAVRAMLDDEDLRRSLGEAGRRRVEAEFGRGSMARRCRSLLLGRTKV